MCVYSVLGLRKISGCPAVHSALVAGKCAVFSSEYVSLLEKLKQTLGHAEVFSISVLEMG